MGFGVFSGNTSVSIKAGQAVKFDDSTGGPHNLVTGMGGTFTAASGAPAEFTPTSCYTGLRVNGGDVHVITFPVAGTYNITCTFHPGMEAKVTVS
jgi:plastocyanin